MYVCVRASLKLAGFSSSLVGRCRKSFAHRDIQMHIEYGTLTREKYCIVSLPQRLLSTFFVQMYTCGRHVADAFDYSKQTN